MHILNGAKQTQRAPRTESCGTLHSNCKINDSLSPIIDMSEQFVR